MPWIEWNGDSQLSKYVPEMIDVDQDFKEGWSDVKFAASVPKWPFVDLLELPSVFISLYSVAPLLWACGTCGL